ncbi:MAG: hypothetical protein H6R10_404 [Rhodocyclaceae bacterium]|nr:hypothetical protein [Rhodocyclaceae bacterium]
MRKSIIAVIAAFSLAALPAHADRGGYYRGGGHYGGHYQNHGGHHGGDSVWAGLAIVGAIAGLAILADQARPRYAVPYEAQPVYPPQPTYVEPPPGPAPVPAPAASATWYYCPSAQAYYPYLRDCPGGWQVVPANPY